MANAWRTERWDSLRLLTPNWQCRLPGAAYDGDDPDGFMTMPEVVSFLEGYARTIAASVHAGTTVTSVRHTDSGYRVATDQGEWECRAVAIMTGAFNRPSVPVFAGEVPPGVTSLTPMEYRNPAELAEGGVLRRRRIGNRRPDRLRAPADRSSGVTWRWASTSAGLGPTGAWTSIGGCRRPASSTSATTRSTTSDERRVLSMQLVGSTDKATIDLNALSAIGVRIVGRLAGINDGHAQFSGSLRNVCALADLKLGRLLDTVDAASANGMDDELPEPYRLPATTVPPSPPLDLDLASGEIRTVIWATGFRPDYSWLDVPVLDRKQDLIRHDGGIVAAPGMYVIGLPFLRRRKSSFIHGAGDDARDLVHELAGFLARQASPMAR